MTRSHNDEGNFYWDQRMLPIQNQLSRVLIPSSSLRSQALCHGAHNLLNANNLEHQTFLIEFI